MSVAEKLNLNWRVKTMEIKQIKIFQNPSLIVVQDLINDWLDKNAGTFTVTKITELQKPESPTFMVEYTIIDIEANKVTPFQVIQNASKKFGRKR